MKLSTEAPDGKLRIPENPFGEQHFPLFRNITHLTIELACPQVFSTEFYFQPTEYRQKKRGSKFAPGPRTAVAPTSFPIAITGNRALFRQRAQLQLKTNKAAKAPQLTIHSKIAF